MNTVSLLAPLASATPAIDNEPTGAAGRRDAGLFAALIEAAASGRPERVPQSATPQGIAATGASSLPQTTDGDGAPANLVAALLQFAAAIDTAKFAANGTTPQAEAPAAGADLTATTAPTATNLTGILPPLAIAGDAPFPDLAARSAERADTAPADSLAALVAQLMTAATATAAPTSVPAEPAQPSTTADARSPILALTTTLQSEAGRTAVQGLDATAMQALADKPAALANAAGATSTGADDAAEGTAAGDAEALLLDLVRKLAQRPAAEGATGAEDTASTPRTDLPGLVQQLLAGTAATVDLDDPATRAVALTQPGVKLPIGLAARASLVANDNRQAAAPDAIATDPILPAAADSTAAADATAGDEATVPPSDATARPAAVAAARLAALLGVEGLPAGTPSDLLSETLSDRQSTAPLTVQSLAAPAGPGSSAAPASPTGTAAQAASVPVNQLAVHISSQAQAGNHRFDIRLDPVELGRVDIRLEIRADGSTLTHLAVEKPETLDLLRTDQRQLERALQDAGLTTRDGSLSFSLREDPRGRQWQQAYTDATPAGEGTPDETTENADATIRRRLVSLGSIDISI